MLDSLRPWRRRRATARALGLACGVALIAAPTANAHGVGQRDDLPLPGWLFAWAAGAVLLISFVGLGALWRAPRLARLASGRRLASLPSAVSVASGAVGVAIWLGLVACGLLGTQEPASNLLPTAVFIVLWVALPLASAFLGDTLGAFNPWRSVARAVAWAGDRARGGRPGPAPLGLPAWVGSWPAALTLLAFGWLELVYVDRDDPRILAILLFGYGLVQLMGMALFGIEVWTRRGDGLAVYFRLFAGLAPLFRRAGALRLRAPLSGLTDRPDAPGRVAVLCIAIGVTSFDGLSGGGLWLGWSSALQDLATDAGLSPEAALQAAGTIGLLGMCTLIAGAYAAAVALGAPPGKDQRALRERYAQSLVPIALAYVTAHYLSYLLLDGQSVFALLSDPLGSGADLLGTADWTPNYALIGATTIWYLQVGALVVGHVCALVVAHDRALELHSDARAAIRSQNPMLAVMVLFTCLGLWLLSEASA